MVSESTLGYPSSPDLVVPRPALVRPAGARRIADPDVVVLNWSPPSKGWWSLKQGFGCRAVGCAPLRSDVAERGASDPGRRQRPAGGARKGLGLKLFVF
jgi:hypothetical protein